MKLVAILLLAMTASLAHAGEAAAGSEVITTKEGLELCPTSKVAMARLMAMSPADIDFQAQRAVAHGKVAEKAGSDFASLLVGPLLLEPCGGSK